MKNRYTLLSLLLMVCAPVLHAQYVQPERNDTVYIFPKSLFDSSAAHDALRKGTATIKGEAFTKQKNAYGFSVPMGGHIKANKITVYLFPVTPYLLEYVDLKKSKENLKKLRFVYLSNEAYYYHLEAVTNSTGDFTFPEMKPGKYYLEAILPWAQSGTYNQYSGSGYDNYGGNINYYTPKSYTNYHYDKLAKFIEIKNDGEVLEVKLKR